MSIRDEELDEDLGDEEREFEVGVPDDEELEVVTEDEPEAAEPEEQPVAEVEAPKPKFRADARVQTALKRATEAEAKAAELERQLRERDEQLGTERASSLRSMEATLASDLATAKRRLIDAQTLGDYEGVANATEEVGRLASDLSTVKAYASQNGQQSTARERQTEQPAPQQAQVDPRTQAWVQSNTWFVPSSPDYEPEIAVDAQAFARKLEIRLQREGRAGEIGSDDYFSQIDAYVAKSYPDVFDYEPVQTQRKVPQMKANQDVAPVSRQNVAAKPTTKGRVVKLTAEQRDMAERFNPHLPREKAWAEYAKGI